MKTNITKIGAIFLALGICVSCPALRAQTTTTSVTTTKGAFTDYVPGSQTVAVRTETNPAPLRYVVTKQTTIVDESGAPVTLERISPGSPVSIQYTGTGDRLVASRIIVQKSAAAATAPVTTAPVVTEQQTTTTTTRPLTHDEKHAIKEEREHRKHAAKEQIEHEKEALEKAKDKLDDDD
jgi:glucose/arabinose dehydrogenase